jgi:hypothetical protein
VIFCEINLRFAFVGIVRTNTDSWTAGMHVLGLRDIVLKRTDIEEDYDIVELIRSMVREDKRVESGQIVAGACQIMQYGFLPDPAAFAGW